mgnify:CR=1 FL=1
MSDTPDERPPLLGSWAALYAVLVGALVLYIVAGTLVTWAYAP